MLLAIACSVVLALILGIPTLRLRADYLAIVTIAVAEILRLTFGRAFREYFHGKDGVSRLHRRLPQPEPVRLRRATVLTFSANDCGYSSSAGSWSRSPWCWSGS